MIITLNGHELARRADGEQTVGHVLDELRAEIKNAGKVVTQVAIDGTLVPFNWQRRRLLSKPVQLVSRLELTVDEPDNIVRRTTAETTLLANRLAVNAQPLAHKFRLGDEVAANNELADFLDDLQLLVSAVDLISRGTLTAENRDRRQRVLDTANNLVPTLDRLYKAQAAGDYVTVADELEYELPGQITQWVNILNESVSCEEARVE